MRLIELKEKIKNTRIPNRIFRELWAVEVDTVDSHSPEGKIVLADEMQRAVESERLHRVPLSDISKQYLLDTAVPNLIDIAKDNQDRGLVSLLQKFQARLHAKLMGDYDAD